MARPLRIDIEDGWHHVMNRGADHGNVFFDDSGRIEFGDRLADIHDRFGIETHAYCPMETHYHLLLHCPVGDCRPRCSGSARCTPGTSTIGWDVTVHSSAGDSTRN